MGPILISIIGGTIILGLGTVTSIASGALGYNAGHAIGTLDAEKKANLISDENHEVVNLCFEYTCHPEQLFEFLEKDMATLNPDDRLKISLSYSIFQGWQSVKDVSYTTVDGRASDMVRLIKTLLLDDDSGLIYKANYKNKNAWGSLKERYGTDGRYWWIDSNSPLRFKITGTAKRPKPTTKAVAPPTRDKDLIRAVEEVEDMLTKTRPQGLIKKNLQ